MAKRTKTRFIARTIEGSKPSEMPGFIKPQLATLRSKAPKGAHFTESNSTDNLVSFALRLVDNGAWSETDLMVWRHSASDRGMDRKSDHGGLRLGPSSLLFDP